MMGTDGYLHIYCKMGVHRATAATLLAHTGNTHKVYYQLCLLLRGHHLSFAEWISRLRMVMSLRHCPQLEFVRRRANTKAA
jgi:hypothetical protein